MLCVLLQKCIKWKVNFIIMWLTKLCIGNRLFPATTEHYEFVYLLRKKRSYDILHPIPNSYSPRYAGCFFAYRCCRDFCAGCCVHWGGTAKDQPVTVTDDFNIENRTAPAAVVIAASAAKTTDDVTNVGTKSITASFSNKSEANGIWVQHDYPGTVNLVDGLQIKVTSNGRPTSVSTGNSNMKFSHNLCKTWDVAFLIDAYLKKRLWEILW